MKILILGLVEATSVCIIFQTPPLHCDSKITVTTSVWTDGMGADYFLDYPLIVWPIKRLK